MNYGCTFIEFVGPKILKRQFETLKNDFLTFLRVYLVWVSFGALFDRVAVYKQSNLHALKTNTSACNPCNLQTVQLLVWFTYTWKKIYMHAAKLLSALVHCCTTPHESSEWVIYMSISMKKIQLCCNKQFDFDFDWLSLVICDLQIGRNNP